MLKTTLFGRCDVKAVTLTSCARWHKMKDF